MATTNENFDDIPTEWVLDVGKALILLWMTHPEPTSALMLFDGLDGNPDRYSRVIRVLQGAELGFQTTEHCLVLTRAGERAANLVMEHAQLNLEEF